MEQTALIQCPKCGRYQEEMLYDLVEAGDMEGDFKMDCEHCEAVFVVKYAFKPFVETKE